MIALALGALSGSLITLALEHIGDIAMFIGFLLACALWPSMYRGTPNA